MWWWPYKNFEREREREREREYEYKSGGIFYIIIGFGIFE
jgi:hypothetical protein